MDYLFLRHAETDVTDRFEWHGRADPPLSSKGRAHARAAAEKLGDLDHKITTIIASDHCRAVETAHVISQVLRCSVVKDRALRERDLGEWSGLSQREIEQQWPGQLDSWRLGHISGPPGGETDEQVAKRVAHALLSHANGTPAPKLVIAHAGLLRGLLAAAGLPDEEVQPLSGRWLTLVPDRARILVRDEESL